MAQIRRVRAPGLQESRLPIGVPSPGVPPWVPAADPLAVGSRGDRPRRAAIPPELSSVWAGYFEVGLTAPFSDLGSAGCRNADGAFLLSWPRISWLRSGTPRQNSTDEPRSGSGEDESRTTL